MASVSQRVFVSYNRADKSSVQQLVWELEREGITVWWDQYIGAGEEWLDRIDQQLSNANTLLACLGPAGIGKWQHREIEHALYKEIQGLGYLVIPVILPGGWERRSELPELVNTSQRVQFDQPVVVSKTAIQQLIAAIQRKPFRPRKAESLTFEAPFPGLATFDEQDSPYFFGREEQVQRLLTKLRPGSVSNDQTNERNRFLAVVGASGSGKSSLVRAGLIPAIRNGEFQDSSTWSILIFRPAQESPDPLHNLFCALAKAFPTNFPLSEMEEWISRLRNDPHQMTRWLAVESFRQPSSFRLILVVDQFEEVFTVCQDPDSRRVFIDALLFAAAEPCGKVITVITLRSDFYTRCAEHSQLANKLSDHQELLGPLSETQLRDIIIRPAIQAGCEVEPGLVDVLLAAMKNQRSGLPLLQFTLRELWHRGNGALLSLEMYHEIGELEGALDQEANRVFNKLTSVEQYFCRQILLRMVQPSEGHVDARRRALIHELRGIGEPKTVDHVLQTLIDGRLVTADRNATHQLTKEGFVDIAHERLITGWKRLGKWIEEERDNIRTQNQLTDEVKKWQANQRDCAYLFRGARLLETEEWRASASPSLTPEEEAFLTESVTARDTERRQQLRQAYWIAGLAILVVIVLIGEGIYYQYASFLNEQGQALTRAENVQETDLGGIPEVARATVQHRDTVLSWVDKRLAQLEKLDPPDFVRTTRLTYYLWLLLRQESDQPLMERRKKCLDWLTANISHMSATQVAALRSELSSENSAQTKYLWFLLNRETSASADRPKRLRAVAVLSKTDAENATWKICSELVLDDLVRETSVSDLTHWLDALRDVRIHLYGPLVKRFKSLESLPEADRIRLADIAAQLAKDAPEILVDLLEFSEPPQFVNLFKVLENYPKDRFDACASFRRRIPTSQERESILSNPKESPAFAKRWANCAVAIVRLGKADDFIWRLLASSQNPLLRSYLIHRFAELEADPRVLILQIQHGGIGRDDPSVRQALILSLGEFVTDRLPRETSSIVWLPEFIEEFQTGRNAGIHSAIEWLARRCGRWDQLADAERHIREGFPSRDWLVQRQWLANQKGWYMNSQNQSFAICESPGIVTVGSSQAEQRMHSDIKLEREQMHQRRIDRRFAVGLKELTKGEYRQFFNDTKETLNGDFKPEGKDEVSRYSPNDTDPMNCLTWYVAAKYCNWLSRRDGLPDDELCYEPEQSFKKGMIPRPNYLSRLGYRLPTEAEWEYACRANTKTSRCFGDSEELLARYAWYSFSSYRDAEQRRGDLRLHVGGTLKPNDFGLFDILGSCDEWCQERFVEWKTFSPDMILDDKEDTSPVEGDPGDRRVARGGSLVARPIYLRSANRYTQPPDTSAAQNRNCIGLRIARTLPSNSGR